MPRRTPADARRRALGQNFLHDQQVVADVLNTIHPPPSGLVVDLGAGAGALTAAAAARGWRVLAVELDPRWAAHLRARARGWGDVTVVHGDALAVALPAEPFAVVSSAPYGAGTAIVRRLLTDAHGLGEAAIVLQLEAARRLAGRPRSSRFAAQHAPWFAVDVGRRIAPEAFRPVPSVRSAVLRLAPRARPLLSPAAYAPYDAFLARIFARREPTLGERLRAVAGGGAARRALSSAGAAAGAQPSAVAPEAYARLFAALQAGGRRRQDHVRRMGA
ncbi:MAG TPA: rRNA adenine N-6-methyltransferase family protein [Capillimicrobium sp.]|jgi:23S rRNA (adenine-N6)-dimethyltransferase